jgi:hypothetical protein
MRSVFLFATMLAILVLVQCSVAANGNLTLTSTPPGATITLDSTVAGVTPLTLTNISAKPYDLSVSLTTYQTNQTTFILADGDTLTVNMPLVILKRSLPVSSTPGGATIYLDNGNIGITPFTIPSVSYGSHTLTLKLTGYQDLTLTLPVNSTTPDVNVNLTSVVAATTTIPATTNGSVFIEINPPTARIYMNSTYKGAAPLYIYNLTPGTYDVLIQMGGYTDKNDQFIVTPNNQTHYYLYMSALTTTNVQTQTTEPTPEPTTVATTVKTPKKTPSKSVTSWPSETAKPSPGPEVFAILGAAGIGLLAARRKH